MSDSSNRPQKEARCGIEEGIRELAQLTEYDLCQVMGIAERHPRMAEISSLELDGEHAAYLRCDGHRGIKYYVPGLNQAEVQRAVAMLQEAKIIAEPKIVRLPR